MRRIPVAVTTEENAALHWLQHFARPDQLPTQFHHLRKSAAHIIIKSLSTSDFSALIACFAAAQNPATSTPTP